jgi:hypothetical protein
MQETCREENSVCVCVCISSVYWNQELEPKVIFQSKQNYYFFFISLHCSDQLNKVLNRFEPPKKVLVYIIPFCSFFKPLKSYIFVYI